MAPGFPGAILSVVEPVYRLYSIRNAGARGTRERAERAALHRGDAGADHDAGVGEPVELAGVDCITKLG